MEPSGLPFDPVNLLTLTGAAGVLYLFVKWLADGRFHTHSEVEGLRQDKVELLAVNKEQAAAVKEGNELLKKSLDTVREAQEENEELRREIEALRRELGKKTGA